MPLTVSSIFKAALVLLFFLGMSFSMEPTQRVDEILDARIYREGTKEIAVYCTIPQSGTYLLPPEKFAEIRLQGIKAYTLAAQARGIPEEIVNMIWNMNFLIGGDYCKFEQYDGESLDLKLIDVGHWWLVGSFKKLHRFIRWLSSLPIKIGALHLFGLGMTFGAKQASSLSEFENLMALNLRQYQIQDHGMKKIAKLTKLRILDIGHNVVTDASVCLLSSLTNLEELHLKFCKTGHTAAQAISQLTKLRVLDLDACSIKDEGLKHLVNLPVLENLNVSDCKIGPAGVQTLTQLTNLKVLDISDNAIFDEGAFPSPELLG